MIRSMSSLLVGAALAITLAPGQASAQASWNAKFGAIPTGSYLTGELGYSAVPKASYMFGLSEKLALGPAFAFDLGYYQTRVTNPGLTFSLPIRLSALRSGNRSLGINFEPGIYLVFPQFGGTGVALMLNVGGNFGVEVAPGVTVGGGVDLPIALGLSPQFSFILPILFGPIVEYRVVPELALTFEMKLGPHIAFGDGFSTVNLGLKLAAGVAYRL